MTDSTIIENKDGDLLSWEAGISQALLQKGIKVILNKEGRLINCRVSDWYYETTNESPPRLRVVVDVLREPIFEKLDSEVQDFLRFLISLVIILVFGLVGYVIYLIAAKPILFWGFIGYYIRRIALIAIIVVGLIVAGRTKGYISKKTFAGQLLGLTYSALTLIMAGAWWFYVSPPPNELKMYPGDYANYAYYLGQQFKQSILLPLISVSWLAGLFKLIGWSTLAELMGIFASIFKKKEG